MTILEERSKIEVIRKYVLNEAKEALKNPFIFDKYIENIAIIGAGPSGLASARRLRDAGLKVKVFERNSKVGGVWAYSDKPCLKPKMPTSRIKHTVDSSTLSILETDKVKTKMYEMTPEINNLLLTKNPPSAVYRDLYNNTDTSLFSFPDYPFPEGTPGLCPHQVTLEYLQNFAKHFDLLSLITFNTSVDLVTKNQDNHTWDLVLSKYDVYSSGMVREQKWKETFDAIVLANGMVNDPFVPDIKDLAVFDKAFPEKLMHSKQYRRPEGFKDKNVLIVGGSVSAVDIARGLDEFTKNLYLSIDGPFETPVELFNIIRGTLPKSVIIKPKIQVFSNTNGDVDGTICFEDGSSLNDIDRVIFCTGFANHMSFLGNLVIEKDESESKLPYPKPRYDDVPKGHVVMTPKVPLNVFHEVFLISDPTLAFIGHPNAFSNPVHFDSQSQAVARVWSGRAYLPNTELMYKFTSEFDPKISPFDLFEAGRLRREPFIVWVNYHAKQLQRDNEELPEIENYPNDYEEKSQKTVKAWPELSRNIYQAIKEQILNGLA